MEGGNITHLACLISSFSSCGRSSSFGRREHFFVAAQDMKVDRHEKVSWSLGQRLLERKNRLDEQLRFSIQWWRRKDWKGQGKW